MFPHPAGANATADARLPVAYHPRYLCPGRLGQLMIDNTARIRSMLVPTIAGLEYAIAECLNCAAVTRVVRFKPTTATGSLLTAP